MSKTIAYLRVSTADQDLEKNKGDILFFANHHNLGQVTFVEEVVSGRKPWRSGILPTSLSNYRQVM